MKADLLPTLLCGVLIVLGIGIPLMWDAIKQGIGFIGYLLVAGFILLLLKLFASLR